MNKLVALFTALLLAGGGAVANAGALVDVSVMDRSSGKTLEVYPHRGRLYVAGTPGNRYTVLLRNHSAGRVLTVLSVDGVNALNGQTAATSQSGYVLVGRAGRRRSPAGGRAWTTSPRSISPASPTAMPVAPTARRTSA
jgi:hypothetical protein